MALQRCQIFDKLVVGADVAPCPSEVAVDWATDHAYCQIFMAVDVRILRKPVLVAVVINVVAAQINHELLRAIHDGHITPIVFVISNEVHLHALLVDADNDKVWPVEDIEGNHGQDLRVSLASLLVSNDVIVRAAGHISVRQALQAANRGKREVFVGEGAVMASDWKGRVYFLQGRARQLDGMDLEMALFMHLKNADVVVPACDERHFHSRPGHAERRVDGHVHSHAFNTARVVGHVHTSEKL